MNYDIEAMDMDMLNEVRSILKARWPEMVEGFLEDTEMYIENIKNGFANDDKMAVASSAHPLKSSSGSMGFTGLSEIAKKIEYDAKDAIENGGDIYPLQELVPLLEEGMEYAKAKLRATLEDAA